MNEPHENDVGQKARHKKYILHDFKVMRYKNQQSTIKGAGITGFPQAKE